MGFPVRRSEDTSNSTSSTRQLNTIKVSQSSVWVVAPLQCHWSSRSQTALTVAELPPTLSSCKLPLYWEQWKNSLACRSEHWMNPYEVSSFSITPVSRSAAEVPLGYPLCPLLWSRFGSKLICLKTTHSK